MKKLGILLILIMVVVSVFSGCVVKDKVTSLKESFNKDEQRLQETGDTPTVHIEPETTPETTPAMISETKEISLFFVNADNKLVAEERNIPKVEGIARATMEELLKGPAEGDLKAAIPTTTKLLDINVRPEGLAIVDLSNELIKDLTTSQSAEELAVFSIVNTLTQFPTVDKVELRVDGRKVDTLLGYVKIDDNLVRNTSLLK